MYITYAKCYYIVRLFQYMFKVQIVVFLGEFKKINFGCLQLDIFGRYSKIFHFCSN